MPFRGTLVPRRTSHVRRGGLVVGLIVLLAALAVVQLNARQQYSGSAACGIRMKLLVLSADGGETTLPAIRQTLDYLGTPYDLFIASNEAPLDASRLVAGCTAQYQGVIATTAELGHWGVGGFVADFGTEEFAALDAFESAYGIRRVIWYSYPTPSLGWNWPTAAVDTQATPITGTFTAEGSKVFARVNTASPYTIKNAYTYLAQPLDASTTPLIVDGSGNALAVRQTLPDGRQRISMSFDGNQYLQHTLVLAYDLVGWVTQGVFLGERHVYSTPQIDDLFLHNQMWSEDTPCTTHVDQTTATYRITGNDYLQVVNWQRRTRQQPLTANVRLNMAFNGEGATGIYPNDTLTPAVKQYRADFFFVSHTWDHDDLTSMSAANADIEIRKNVQLAKQMKLPNDASSMVTPNVSGLTNPAFLKTAYKHGIRFLVSDTSRAGYSNPSPNTGLWNTYQPGIYMIPRYPNNLFFNVSTPKEWAAEYNCMYRAYWGRDLTYEEIVDITSDTFVTYLLKGDLNPLMFHQPNLRAYDGRRTLLGDLLDATFQKYSRLMKLPILSPSMTEVGMRMIMREQYNAAGVSAVLVPGQGITVSASKSTWVPITGISSSTMETYGGQPISYVSLDGTRSKSIAFAR